MYHKALFYQNVILPKTEHLMAVHHSKMKGGATALQKGYASEMRAWVNPTKNPDLKSNLNLVVHSSDPNAYDPLMNLKTNQLILDAKGDKTYNQFADFTNRYSAPAQKVIEDGVKYLLDEDPKYQWEYFGNEYMGLLRNKLGAEEFKKAEEKREKLRKLKNRQQSAQFFLANLAKKEIQRAEAEEKRKAEAERKRIEAEKAKLAQTQGPKILTDPITGEKYDASKPNGGLLYAVKNKKLVPVGEWYETKNRNIVRNYYQKSGRGRGGSITSALLDPVGTLKNSLTAVGDVFLNGRHKLLPSAQKIVEQYGNDPITSMVIMRTPLGKTLMATANALTWGQLYANMKSNNIDDYFHLQLFVKVKGEWISIEKESTIKVSKKDLETTKKAKKGEILPVGFPPSLTINTLLGKTQSAMGDEKFFGYSAKDNNCANFVDAMLSANGLANARTKKFVSQNVEGAFTDYTRKMANTLTDLGHYAETGYEGGAKHDTRGI